VLGFYALLSAVFQKISEVYRHFMSVGDDRLFDLHEVRRDMEEAMIAYPSFLLTLVVPRKYAGTNC
jgi:hypothetical protein